jgi:hypothetical protein
MVETWAVLNALSQARDTPVMVAPFLFRLYGIRLYCSSPGVERNRRGMMNGQAHDLAERFREMNEGVIRFAANCSEADWRRIVPHEGRSVAYLIDHIAWGYAVETKAMLTCLTGQEQPLAPDELPHTFTREDLHAMNSARWQANPYPDRQATITRLQVEGERTANVIEGLTEQDLGRTVTYGPIPERTAAEFIESPVISHQGMHLPGIRQALAASSHDETLGDRR